MNVVRNLVDAFQKDVQNYMGKMMAFWRKYDGKSNHRAK